MNKILKTLALTLSALMLVTLLTACGGSGGELYIFNTKGENAEAMQAACDAFSKETGIPVKLFSLGSGTDSLELMRTEMNARQKPAIFCIMSPAELGEWVEGGFARPL
ncbi:MAG: carbohydrate ABC transporter substrate-binding protein, partial [Ruminococcaceae bacterium]|nr:carbohydrate ABC transporter substrate-binding protein [Oscillospiraceae bacterium]